MGRHKLCSVLKDLLDVDVKLRCLLAHQLLLSFVPKAKFVPLLYVQDSYVVVADSVETRVYNKHGVINWSFMVGGDTDSTFSREKLPGCCTF